MTVRATQVVGIADDPELPRPAVSVSEEAARWIEDDVPHAVDVAEQRRTERPLLSDHDMKQVVPLGRADSVAAFQDDPLPSHARQDASCPLSGVGVESCSRYVLQDTLEVM